jgi:hypothetical protein
VTEFKRGVKELETEIDRTPDTKADAETNTQEIGDKKT